MQYLQGFPEIITVDILPTTFEILLCQNLENNIGSMLSMCYVVQTKNNEPHRQIVTHRGSHRRYGRNTDTFPGNNKPMFLCESKCVNDLPLPT